jgi:methyltransferase (TIGR00027 family)
VRAAHPPWPVPVTPAEADAETAFPWRAMTTYVGARSRFFDEYLVAGGSAGIRQAVILGAGLDARAFRLDWPPGTTVHEIDAPRVLEFKDSVLRSHGALPRCERRLVPRDLRGDWPSALRDAGFDPARPAAWLAEGLLAYLDEETKESLLAGAHELSAPGSRIAIEHQPDIARMRDESFVRESNKRLDFDLPDLWPAGSFDPVSWLAGHGWMVTVAPITDVAEGYGRPLDDTMPVMRAAVLITALRS